LYALAELLEGDLDGEKVIVFTRFRKMVDIAAPYLKGKGFDCVRITGAEDAGARRESAKRFQDPKDKARVCFITTAGAEAVNLQAAKAIIFYDSPWSAGDYLQVLGRMIRIGSQHDKVYAIHLITQGTIDGYVAQVLKRKMNLIEAVLGKRLKGDSVETETTVVEQADDGPAVISNTSDVNELFDTMLQGAKRQKAVK
jgi:SNF2 family DNA or RNA helicase